MEINLKGTPKETADLVLAIQDQLLDNKITISQLFYDDSSSCASDFSSSSSEYVPSEILIKRSGRACEVILDGVPQGRVTKFSLIKDPKEAFQMLIEQEII